MPTEYALPPYIYTEDHHRAYLTFTQNVQGKWIAAYTAYFNVVGQPDLAVAEIIMQSHAHDDMVEAANCLAVQKDFVYV